MAKNINGHKRATTTSSSASFDRLTPDELKALVRDGLVSMNMAERETFIQALEGEIEKFGFNIRSYLVPLGIPGRSPEDFTPTEVGHLVRYLKINVPTLGAAIDKALSRFTVFSEKVTTVGGKIAA